MKKRSGKRKKRIKKNKRKEGRKDLVKEKKETFFNSVSTDKKWMKAITA